MWEMTEIPHRKVGHRAPCLREPHGRVSTAGPALLPASNSTHQRPTVGGSCLPISPITKQHGAVGRLSKHIYEMNMVLETRSHLRRGVCLRGLVILR